MDLVRATLASDNSVYIQLAADLGPDKVKETARMMGIKSKLLGYCAETLGGLEDGVSPLEMASAYATIANGGYRNRPRVIRKVTTRQGRTELPKRWRVHRVKAFEDGVTYEATKILQQNMTSGTGGHAQIGCPAAGKTGTTDKNIDAWFVGFTPRLATAVWVGFPGDARVSMNGMYAPTGGNIDGGTYPADIWGAYMKQAVGKYCGDFKQPTEPFQSQPFFGHYSRIGQKAEDKNEEQGTGGGEPEPEEDKPKTEKPGPGADDTTPGGTEEPAFDPNQYETPPQGDPGTGTPGGTQGPPDDG
jgi:penicillin-binding protein 1A